MCAEEKQIRTGAEIIVDYLIKEGIPYVLEFRVMAR